VRRKGNIAVKRNLKIGKVKNEWTGRDGNKTQDGQFRYQSRREKKNTYRLVGEGPSKNVEPLICPLKKGHGKEIKQEVDTERSPS